MWRRSNMELTKVGRILAKQKLQSFQNPKDERRLVQNLGIECSHTAVECSFFSKFFRSNNSETNFSKNIRNIKDWQTESCRSKPLHLGFMQLDLYFLTGIFLKNNVHHKLHRSHTIGSHASSLCKFATGDFFKPDFQIQVLPESIETVLNVKKPTCNFRIVNYNLNMSVHFVHNICLVTCALRRSNPLCDIAFLQNSRHLPTKTA